MNLVKFMYWSTVLSVNCGKNTTKFIVANINTEIITSNSWIVISKHHSKSFFVQCVLTKKFQSYMLGL